MPQKPRHLFVTQNFFPEGGGMARRHTETVLHLGEPVIVSTVASSYPDIADPANIAIERQPFGLNQAKRFSNEMRWAASIIRRHGNAVDVLHCGEIRPVGYAVWRVHRALALPYFIYVNGGDLLRERAKSASNPIKRLASRRILGDASGIIANSAWTAALAEEVMHEAGIPRPPRVAAIELGTDPEWFHPRNDTRMLRARLGVGDAPIMLTVARVVPHKGQDTAVHALAMLAHEFPNLQYLVVGEGDDTSRVRDIAGSLDVASRVHFIGPLRDDALREAYATSDLYVGPSRLDRTINVEGFGISFIEAAASGLPAVAGDSGGVRSAVRDGETGFVVDPDDVAGFAARIGSLLRDRELRARLGNAARAAAESHYNWARVGRETREFVHDCLRDRANDRSRSR